jgi:MoxR-like ATPase
MSLHKTHCDQVMQLPASVVVTAAHNLKLSASTDKQACAVALADALCHTADPNALMTIIRTTIPAKQTISRGAEMSSVQGNVDTLSIKVNTLTSNVDSLENAVNQVKATQTERDTDITNRLADLASKLGAIKVDQSAVDSAVTAAVAASFKPFERLVKANKAEAVIAEAVSVRVVNRWSAYDVFGVDITDRTGAPMMIDVWNHPECPAIDPNFIWSKDILTHLLLSQDTGENLWFGGEKGTGKSETARQFAARTGRGYTRINFHKYSTAADYLGDKSLSNGNTGFECGDFLKAWAVPSTVILLDEITNCPAGELAPLNGLLEPNSQVSIGGAVRIRAAGVLVFAADNTLTNGDETGRYAGTQTMNSALADRFARVISFKHMPADKEIDAVVRHTGCDVRLATHVVALVNACRARVETGDMVDSPSIRQIIGFIRALRLLPVDQAWSSAIGNRQPSESATALEAIKAAYLSEETINKLLEA